MSAIHQTLALGKTKHQVQVKALGDGHFEVQIDGQTERVRLVRAAMGHLVLERADGRRLFGVTASDQKGVHVALNGQGFDFQRISADAETGEGSDFKDPVVKSPMTGKVLELRCAVGDVVPEGAPLVVVEAMKMEHRLDAPQAARVKAIFVAGGDRVDLGQKLIELEFEESA